MFINSHSNLSAGDRFWSYQNYLKYYLKFFKIYRRQYRNYVTVITHVLRGKYPINVSYRDGTRTAFQHYYDVYNDIFGIKSEPVEDLAYVDGYKFYGGKTNGDISSIFKGGDYSDLPVKDRVVIDLGANIGDSAIYFASRGAKLVLAFEPDEMCYNLALKNIEANDFGNVINLVRAGCASNQPDTKNASDVPQLSLDEIIKKFQIDDAILKMDCEGCEYEVILNTSREILRRFSHLKLEYHQGYRDLRDKLRSFGFDVTTTSPRYFRPHLNPNSLNLHFTSGRWKRLSSIYLGWLNASRI